MRSDGKQRRHLGSWKNAAWSGFGDAGRKPRYAPSEARSDQCWIVRPADAPKAADLRRTADRRKRLRLSTVPSQSRQHASGSARESRMSERLFQGKANSHNRRGACIAPVSRPLPARTSSLIYACGRASIESGYDGPEQLARVGYSISRLRRSFKTLSVVLHGAQFYSVPPNSCYNGLSVSLCTICPPRVHQPTGTLVHRFASSP